MKRYKKNPYLARCCFCQFFLLPNLDCKDICIVSPSIRFEKSIRDVQN